MRDRGIRLAMPGMRRCAQPVHRRGGLARRHHVDQHFREPMAERWLPHRREQHPRRRPAIAARYVPVTHAISGSGSRPRVGLLRVAHNPAVEHAAAPPVRPAARVAASPDEEIAHLRDRVIGRPHGIATTTDRWSLCSVQGSFGETLRGAAYTRLRIVGEGGC